jgi:outer membrane protein insertion porin family
MHRGSLFSPPADGLRRLACAAVLSITVFAPVCAAQAAPQDTRGHLASITVLGSSRFRSDEIAAATGLRVGSEINREDLQKAADALAQLGPFASVQYRFSSTDQGVQAEYRVTDAPAVPISFDNFPWFSDGELVGALKDSVALFDGAAPAHGTILDAMADALATLLVKHGIQATVSHTLVVAPVSGGQVQQFRAEGADVSVTGVEFNDALAQSDRAVQTRLADLVGKPFSRRAIELFEFEQVRPIYLAHAFLRVRFGPASAKFTGGPGSARVAVIAPVEPGPAYVWSGVAWSGHSAIASAELGALVPLNPGDLADGMKIEGAWLRVRDAYAQRGYLDADLNAVAHFDDAAKSVRYAVALSEGPQYRMGRLVLTGLSVEGERRIRTAWLIPAGAVFDKGKFDEFLATGVKQAFAGLPLHYERIGRFLQQDPKSGLVDVMLDFQ